MNTELLKQTDQDVLGSARQIQSDFIPQIEQKARTLEMGDVISRVRNRPV